MSVCVSVRTSVHPQKVSSISMKFGMYVEVDSDARRYTGSKVNVTSPSKLEMQPFSKAISSAIYNESWQLTTYS